MNWIDKNRIFILKSGSEDIQYILKNSGLKCRHWHITENEWLHECGAKSKKTCQLLKKGDNCILHQREIYEDDIEYINQHKGGE